MTAQVGPAPATIDGGFNNEADLTVVAQPTAIVNARYARSGALSKRNGYRFDPSAPLPTVPYSSEEHEYVAFDGDKFVARKTPDLGLTFYQRRGITGVSFGRSEQRELRTDQLTVNGTASRLRPLLTPVPAQQGPTSAEGLLCDVAAPGVLLVDDGQVYVYVRLEMTGYDVLRQADIFDIVVEYIDSVDTRLTVREPSRLRAITYTPDIHRQIRVLERNDANHGLTFVYTHDSATGGKGIYARTLRVGADAASDVWSAQFSIVDTTGGLTVAAVLSRNSAGFDCDEFLHNSGNGAFSVIYPTTYGIAWARVDAAMSVARYDLLHAEGSSQNNRVRSIAMTGLQVGAVQEVAFSVIMEWSLQRNFAGRFNAIAGGGPTGLSTLPFQGVSEVYTNMVEPHSAVAGRFQRPNGDDTYLAGINTGAKGFLYALCDSENADFWTPIHCVACAWATGRPHTIYSHGDAIRDVIPMVSFGGVLGGGAGLLADVTPLSSYQSEPRDGLPLLATYGIDQVALSTKTVSNYAFPDVPPIRTADWNAGLRMKPCHGSAIAYASFAVPRWIAALGVPPTATLLEFQENTTDFEFVEPGVMLTGAGVPLMLDTIHGVSELGFHASPALLFVGAGHAVPAGAGYPIDTILQYRFQYRFVDGFGRSQVSPPTDPIQVTATFADLYFAFTIAPLDVTLRHLGAVVIDVYRTEPGLATFYWAASLASQGGNHPAQYVDYGPALTTLDKTRTLNVENYFMTPPCATHAFRGAFRDVIVTRENELWPSKRRLSTTAPQFDIVDAAAWDAQETVQTGGEIDGKLVLFSKSRIAYTYEVNGTLAPFVDIPSDTGATEGSRAFSTHLGIFYQSRAGLRIVGRDLALHEVGFPVRNAILGNTLRGGIKVPEQGEIRLRLDDGRTYLVFDYFHGGPDQPVWYVTRFNEQGGYTDEDGQAHIAGVRAIADQAFAPDGRLLYLCRLGFLLEETFGRFRDEDQWVAMRVRSGPLRGSTAIAYLATIEAAVNLELPPTAEPGPVTLRLFGDYEESRPSQPIVTQAWTVAEIEGFDRRQLQITSGEKVMNAPAVQIEYSDERAGDVSTTSDGYGYRLSAMVFVAGPREQKSLFPVSNGARK